MKKILFTILSLFILLFSYSQDSNPYDNPSDWDSIFVDHFSTGTVPNPSHWIVSHNKGRWKEWHKSGNVKIENGNLVLSATKESGFGKTIAGSEVSTGTNKQSTDGNFKYGFFEAHCKLPDGPIDPSAPGGRVENDSPFTAFWLSVKNGKFTYKHHPPEIDIFEIADTGNKIDRNAGRIGKNDGDSVWSKEPRETITDAFFDDWHVFGALWTPDIVKFYVDGVLVDSQIVDLHESLRVTLSYQISREDLVNIDEDFKIDWVKVYEPKTPYVDPVRWGHAYNNDHNYDGSRCFGGEWVTKPDDQFFAGDFDTDNSDELLIINTQSGYKAQVGVLSYVDPTETAGSTSEWERDYGQFDGKFNTEWYLGPDDKFTVGNFSTSNKDEVMLTGILGYANMFTYNATTDSWTRQYTNGGSSKIGTDPNSWNMNNTDKYIVGNFDTSTPEEELLCISTTGHAKIFKFDDSSSNWIKLWGSGYSYKIGTWSLDADDKFYTGDFDGDSKIELLCISDSDYAEFLEYNPSTQTWSRNWTNSSTPGKIGSWHIGSGDRFYSGDWDDDGDDDLVCISGTNAYNSIQDFNTNQWYSDFGNGGDGRFYDWWVRSSDKFTVGNFTKDELWNSNAQLLMVRGTQSFIPHNSPINHLRWRTCLMYSPECTFANNAHAKSAQIPTKPVAANLNEDLEDWPKHKTLIYPNPSVNGRFYTNFETITYIEVFTLDGKKMISSNFEPNQQIDLSSFNKGIYLVRGRNGNTQFSEKIIFQ